MDETLFILLALRIADLPSLLFFRLLENLKDLRSLKKTSFKELMQFGFSDKRAERVCQALNDEKEVLKTFSLCRKNRISLLSFFDPLYPNLLKEIPDRPYLLFYQGALPKNSPLLAVVGSRNMTLYGKKILPELLTPLIREGVGIISGLAYGVDSEAHRLTLKEGGYTIAVLGSGLMHIYPKEHQNLARKIIDFKGLLISEYPPLASPRKDYFPERNRIIAGLSQAVLVVEAGLKSGTKITAKFALEYNREVFAVPGDIDKESSKGTNNLIKEGAFPITETEDIALSLGISLPKGEKRKLLEAFENLSKEEKKIIEILKNMPETVDKIASQVGLSIREVLVLLTELEIKGLISRESQGYYSLK